MNFHRIDSGDFDRVSSAWQLVRPGGNSLSTRSKFKRGLYVGMRKRRVPGRAYLQLAG